MGWHFYRSLSFGGIFSFNWEVHFSANNNNGHKAALSLWPIVLEREEPTECSAMPPQWCTHLDTM